MIGSSATSANDSTGLTGKRRARHGAATQRIAKVASRRFTM